MKLLVVGSRGQLGSDCCALLNEENEITGCDIPVIDITSKDSVDSYISEIQPEVIINCAAYTAVDGCESELDLSWKVNAEGPKYLAQAAQKIGSRLIQVSTDYIFDGNRVAPQPYFESDSPNPLSQYGRSKLAGEEAVAENCSNYVILRTAWLYSSTGKNFLKTILRLVTQDSKRELKVVDDQYGSLTWSYTLAQQIQKLLRSDLTGVMHTTSEGYSTWYQAAKYFLDTMDVPYAMRPCTTAEYPTPAHRPANSILENKVLNDAGLSTFVDWKDDINSFVAKHREDLLKEAREG